MTAHPAAQPHRGREMLRGFSDSTSVGLGVFPLGIALGMLVIQAGLPWWMAPALSTIVLAGSVELLLVSLISTVTPLVTIAFTVFAMNFRHVFYSFSFPLDRVPKGPARWYSVYVLIDEAYATYAAKDRSELSGTRIVTMQLFSQFYWVAGGLVGVVIAHSLPAPIQGFEFALCALFTVMTLDAFRGRQQVPSTLLAGLSVTLALLITPQAAILVALIIFMTLLIVRYMIWGDQE
jgi:4-azaleucine resistance transporter AzlC